MSLTLTIIESVMGCEEEEAEGIGALIIIYTNNIIFKKNRTIELLKEKVKL